MRIGLGYDSHRFDASRPLQLGGITIPDHPGLAGHSDGDAVAHAITDAVLGAIADGNIGSHFPPSDERWRGADSVELLGVAMGRLRDRGYRVVNVDVTVICETPKIGPHATAMCAALAPVLGISADDDLSIKGKTNEGMGWIGSGEGLSVHAVALVTRA
jgi:2-C-methyl-D-erythritol 2,4-cyclodiphosphate synthase